MTSKDLCYVKAYRWLKDKRFKRVKLNTKLVPTGKNVSVLLYKISKPSQIYVVRNQKH